MSEVNEGTGAPRDEVARKDPLKPSSMGKARPETQIGISAMQGIKETEKAPVPAPQPDEESSAPESEQPPQPAPDAGGQTK